jgi:hypothetical protein
MEPILMPTTPFRPSRWRAPGVATRIFAGEQAAQGVLHHHPEEQWGVLLEGSAAAIGHGH